MVFISSPNNPTGNMATEPQVRGLLEMGLVVVVDEAYYEFSGETVAGLVHEHENLVVLRTMSKWAGLAGLRIGYGIMSPALVDHVIDIKPPYNVNVAAEAALMASIEDAPALLDRVRRITQERDRLFSLLEEIPGVTPWPSSANFILLQFAPGRAQLIYEGLAERGIFLRGFDSQRLVRLPPHQHRHHRADGPADGRPEVPCMSLRPAATIGNVRIASPPGDAP